MKKTYALKKLGGNMQNAANELGVTIQAVYQWPDPLTERIKERVAEAVLKKIKREKAAKSRKAKRDD